MIEKTKLILVGGFLGAGKTTLLCAAAKRLREEGNVVGLITNDQAADLVDTQRLEAAGFRVKEVSGSCFCCDFRGFFDAAVGLRKSECNVILCEPVGSCTDLSATLMQPLKEHFTTSFNLRPLSVLVDPHKLLLVFNQGNTIDDGVDYIYLKQLEEADRLVINKMDTIDDYNKTQVNELLKTRFNVPVDWISALQEKGISDWLNGIFKTDTIGARIANVDYDVYAEAEAQMAWFNASYTIRQMQGGRLEWKEVNLSIIELLRQAFEYELIEIGHVKSFLKCGASFIGANLIETAGEPVITGEDCSGVHGRMVLNIRVKTTPALVQEIVNDVIRICAEKDIEFTTIESRCFRPSRPQPTYHYQDAFQV